MLCSDFINRKFALSVLLHTLTTHATAQFGTTNASKHYMVRRTLARRAPKLKSNWVSNKTPELWLALTSCFKNTTIKTLCGPPCQFKSGSALLDRTSHTAEVRNKHSLSGMFSGVVYGFCFFSPVIFSSWTNASHFILPCLISICFLRIVFSRHLFCIAGQTEIFHHL